MKSFANEKAKQNQSSKVPKTFPIVLIGRDFEDIEAKGTFCVVLIKPVVTRQHDIKCTLQEMTFFDSFSTFRSYGFFTRCCV